MAYQIQAARLNLRMQKELKLLHTDPPPGVSVRLADDCTLTNINAQVEGPEGTVYAKGFFNIKILIPERYPFHPPNVTFTTPIYHPNIDDGGRICLDILNLPPKGAWQPSLNISTVLTSIGLLLSEPNPDDGLKCEVSREYKYSRPAFDQKARSWTQKYAKPGSNAGGATEAVPHPTVVQAGAEFENAAEECRPGSSGKEMIRGGIGRKLSLGCSLRWGDKKNSEGKENIMVSASTAPGPCCEPLGALNGNGEEPQAQGGKGGQVAVEQVSTIIVPDSESEDEGATKPRRLSLKRKISLQGKRRVITLD